MGTLNKAGRYSGLLTLFFAGQMLYCHILHASEKKGLDAIQKDIRSIEGQISKKNRSLKSLSSRLQEIEARIRKLSHKLRKSTDRRKALQLKLQRLRAREQEIARDVKDLEEGLQTYLAADYMSKNSVIQQILGSQPFSDMQRYMAYRNFLYADEVQQRQRLVEKIEEIAAVQKEISAGLQQVEETHRTYLEQKEALSTQHKTRQRLLSALKADIRDDRQRLKNLREEEARLRALVNRLGQRSTRKEPFTRGNIYKSKGHLPWPIKGRLKKRFGQKRYGELRWKGWMLSVSNGTPVKAVHAGKIVFSDWLRGYGLLLIIDHGHGVFSLYGYNESLLKFSGEMVEAGENVAFSGMSDDNEPASYFEIREHGKPVNPGIWLR
ncbi:MAG: hypothetical protein D6698_02675 [Gammaproteobacteria bacterium]|nr:MAG: hypothetical protein D6698_02675 [Gammaproteobacteria bacterium]